jgi:hypothetical protein
MKSGVVITDAARTGAARTGVARVNRGKSHIRADLRAKSVLRRIDR